MSNYNTLKDTINANIKQNGNQEITGSILNSVLNQMVNILGTGYQFAGVATTATNPGTPDAKVFYIANGKGTYTNFGGIEVTEDDVVVLYWDTDWHKEATGIASQAKLTELEGKLRNNSIEFNIIAGKGHSSTLDKIPCDIKAGETYEVTINADAVLSGNITIYEYYLNGEGKAKASVKLGKYLLTASQDVSSIGLYMPPNVFGGDAVVSFSLLWGNELELSIKKYELPSCSFSGDGNKFVDGYDKVTGLLPNVPFKLHIEDVNISMDGAESGIRLQVYLINNKTKAERTILAEPVGTDLKSYYILIPNDGEDTLRISGRCAEGSTFRVYVEQQNTLRQYPYVSNRRLVNNADATEYPSNGDAVFGYYKLNGETLSVDRVYGTSQTAASAFYDAEFKALGIYNANNNGQQDILISYEDIIALYPSAVYVRFSSNKVKLFNINSGVDLGDISSEIVRVFNNKTSDLDSRISKNESIAKTNIAISDTLGGEEHNIYEDVARSKVIIKKKGFILRVWGKVLLVTGEEDLELSYAQADAANGAYVIPISVLEPLSDATDTHLTLSADTIKYVSRYTSDYKTGIILFSTYYGKLIAEGLFADALKVSGKQVLENAFTGAYIEEDVHPVVKRYCALFNDTGEIESFCFFTDPHLVGADNAFDAVAKTKYHHYLGTLRKYYNSCPSDFLVCGGDWLINNDTNEVACYKLGFIDATMRKLFDNFYPVIGNHDYNYLGNNNDIDLTEPTLRNILMRGHEHTYYEFKGKNTRCFVLDCETDHSPEMNDFKWGQIEWIGNRLMENTDEHIIVFQHIYKQGEPEIIPPFADDVLLLLSAFNSRRDIWLNDIHYDFATAKGRVACVIAGHQHKDAIYNDYDVPVFVTTTFNLSEPTFDMILIDYNNNKLHSVRVGIGEDREMNLA